MHAFDVHDSTVGLQFQEFASQIKPLTLPVRPLVADLAARLPLIDANGHRPALGSEHPLLHQRRFDVSAVDRLRRGSETPRHNYVFVSFGLQCHLAHCTSPFFLCSIKASTSSSRP